MDGRVNLKSAWADEGNDGRRAECGPAIVEGARGSVKERGEELLRAIKGEGEAEKIGMAGVRIFFIARGLCRGQMEKHIPRGLLREKFFGRGILAGKFGHAALRAATTLEKGCGTFGGIKGPRRVVVGKRREESGDFGEIGGEEVPAVAIAVVDDGASVENLPDAIGIFANDRDDHVDEFVETEGLPDDGTHADVAGVFIGVAERDLIG